MTNILNITNGDCAVEIMKKADIPGIFLPWRDVLHDGPVPEHLSLQELSTVRAQFIIDRGWGAPDEIIESFIQRDNELNACRKYEKVILWFEHDLYDQLQLLQILDWFDKNLTGATELFMICTEQYLGSLSPEEIKDLMQYKQLVTKEHLTLSARAWSAFRSHSPEKWCRLLNTDTSALPFLSGAIVRLLQEYPSCSNGLSRTAEQVLQVISQGENHPGKVFTSTQKLEERIFLGDSSFWVVLHELLESNPPLITLPEGQKLTLPAGKGQQLSITSAGLKVLAGKVNLLDISPLDRWIGGVHLKAGNAWFWNSDSRSIVKRAE
ncbi:hypothetical protein [Psychromonas ossibalaenae]|uniref:hypothetical protein n=1 Tax=Psychromonas ossibalaenae TaxID=444922 RepID=UPI0003785DCF|nr:hypothetical protein [Psychromonas ossibalaenae]